MMKSTRNPEEGGSRGSSAGGKGREDPRPKMTKLVIGSLGSR